MGGPPNENIVWGKAVQRTDESQPTIGQEGGG